MDQSHFKKNDEARCANILAFPANFMITLSWEEKHNPARCVHDAASEEGRFAQHLSQPCQEFHRAIHYFFFFLGLEGTWELNPWCFYKIFREKKVQN